MKDYTPENSPLSLDAQHIILLGEHYKTVAQICVLNFRLRNLLLKRHDKMTENNNSQEGQDAVKCYNEMMLCAKVCQEEAQRIIKTGEFTQEQKTIFNQKLQSVQKSGIIYNLGVITYEELRRETMKELQIELPLLCADFQNWSDAKVHTTREDYITKSISNLSDNEQKSIKTEAKISALGLLYKILYTKNSSEPKINNKIDTIKTQLSALRLELTQQSAPQTTEQGTEIKPSFITAYNANIDEAKKLFGGESNQMQ